MTRQLWLVVLVFVLACISAGAQSSTLFPEKLLIGSHTFFDIGPPFNFYEVMTVESTASGLTVEHALVTPPGDACVHPATVELKTIVISSSMRDLLKGKNPCDIPEKDLRKEAKRCKHCLVFSGADVTMQVSCGTNVRKIRMDILDRDMFDKTSSTPEQTSWTMAVMSSLDQALGPGVWDKPMFNLDETKQKPAHDPETDILTGLRSGAFDGLLSSEKPLSELVREAEQAHPMPSVVLETLTPDVPITAELPSDPPIAKAAHVGGEISMDFDVAADGHAKNLTFLNGSKLFQNTTGDAIGKWTFPTDAEGHKEHATLLFRLNCGLPATSR